MTATFPLVWVNGQLGPPAERLSVLDRGFTLGDGLFETLRFRSGVAIRLARHLARLRAGADFLEIPLPWDDTALQEAIRLTCQANALDDAAVRLTLSRGPARTRGLLPEPDATPTLTIQALPYQPPTVLAERGVRAILAPGRRNERSPLAQLKSLNALENILARRAAARAGADDALLCNTAGNLAEATAANLFLVLDGQLITPDLASGALPGTVRAAICEEYAAQLGLAVIERAVPLADLSHASEAFLTNALAGILPLVAVEGRPIGTGQPGPVTRALQPAIWPFSV